MSAAVAVVAVAVAVAAAVMVVAVASTPVVVAGGGAGVVVVVADGDDAVVDLLWVFRMAEVGCMCACVCDEGQASDRAAVTCRAIVSAGPVRVGDLRHARTVVPCNDALQSAGSGPAMRLQSRGVVVVPCSIGGGARLQ